MHDEIDKLQQEVDELVDLCADSGAGDLMEEYSPTDEEKKYERLGVMILKMQDGVLEKRYFLRMEKWLLADSEALRYYVDFQQLSAVLYDHFNKSRFRKVLDFIKGV